MEQMTIHNVIRRKLKKVAQFEVDNSSGEQQRTFVDTCNNFMNVIHGYHSIEKVVWLPNNFE
jgi:uncharacterized iron-regulated protein